MLHRFFTLPTAQSCSLHQGRARPGFLCTGQGSKNCSLTSWLHKAHTESKLEGESKMELQPGYLYLGHRTPMGQFNHCVRCSPKGIF